MGLLRSWTGVPCSWETWRTAGLRPPVGMGQTGPPHDPPVLPEPHLRSQPRAKGDSEKRSQPES